MGFAVAMAATMAIPAASSASATDATKASQLEVASFIKDAQSLKVSNAVSTQDVVRDSSSVLYAAAVQQAAGVYGGSALPATSLQIAKNMVINKPDLNGGGAAVVQYALQFVGMVPYILGGDSPSTGFSCDTFVRYVYAQFGVVLHGDAVVEASMGTVVPQSQAVMGDLVYYPHQHIGFYDGAGGIIDAPKPGKDVSHRAIWGNPVFIRL
jgi:cell wall-associated NlpC family hydrolase